MQVAHKTLQAIEAAMRADEGNLFKHHQRTTLPQCEDAYKPESGMRSHLGASLMGDKCSRKLYYSFRWAGREQVEPRMLRLWNRGHLEEGRMVAMLLMIGCKIYQHTEDGKQYRILDHYGHFGGSLDSEIENCPDFPDERVLGEYKTHNEKSFMKLLNEGLHQSKFQHYIQMQIYMRKRGLKNGIYMAVNKNTDQLYAEKVGLNADIADRYIARGGYIIFSPKPPEKISQSESWFECGYCEFKKICHRNERPLKNCRTCEHSVILVDGAWGCALAKAPIPKEVQPLGCDLHAYNPVIWQPK